MTRPARIVELGARLVDRRPHLQSADDAVIELVATRLQLPVGETHGHPGGGRFPVETTAAQGKVETGRHDADHRVRPAIERDRTADDRSVASEPCLPEAVAEHSDVHPRPVFLRRERPPQHRPDAEHVEQVPRHLRHVDAHRRTTPRELGRTLDVRRDPFERLLLTLDIGEVRRRERRVLEVGAREPLLQRHQPFGLVEGKRPDQDGIDDAEGRGVDADAEAERQDYHREEPGMASKRPGSVPQIVQEGRHARLTGCRRGALPHIPCSACLA